MPEGPEVKKFADQLASALKNKYIITISARTKKSREWLEKHPNLLHGKKLLDILRDGKDSRKNGPLDLLKVVRTLNSSSLREFLLRLI
jgi:hypothetical protein